MKLIFLGSQGSGKSTQAKLLAERLKLPNIEMGQLFRQKSNGSDNEANQVKEALKVGNLVPDTIALKVLHQRVAESDCLNGYVLDGYPRNYSQLQGIEPNIDKVFYIKVSDEEAVKRLIKRARADDNRDAIKRRLDLYHKETEPLLSYFRQKGILMEIDGERTIEEIQKDIVEIIENEKNNRY